MFRESGTELTSNWNQPDDKRRVLDATDIVRLVGEHVTLKPKGKEYVCLCPFHNDHNPSMYVVPSKQIFHCFVCGAGGGAIDFVMRLHAMTFIEALKHLADKAGIALSTRRAPARSGDAEGAGVSREQVAEANAFALSFFQGVLRHAEHGAVARGVIEQRGIAPAMVERFRLGAAPDRWDGLLQTIQARGLRVEAFVAAGLLKAREGGSGWYDAMRNRLIFPILDQLGRPVAFGGRKIKPEDEPKYLNSPETALFHKSATLFALPQAFRAIQNERCAVVTEGYTDAIACHQAGFDNAVATLGTALTPGHASILRRVCDRVVLLFDNDEAGQKAADRAMEVFFTEPVDVLVMSLPGGKDPDEVLKSEGGVEAFRTALVSARPMLDYFFDRFAAQLRGRGAAPGTATRARMIEEALATLSQWGLDRCTPLRRQSLVTRFARLAEVGTEVIEATLSRGRRRLDPAAVAPTGGSAEPLARGVRSPSELGLACLLACPELSHARRTEALELVRASAPRGELFEESGVEESTPTSMVAAWAVARLESGLEASLPAALDELEDAGARAVATDLARYAERLGADDTGVSGCFDDACRRHASLLARRDVASLVESRPEGADLAASIAGLQQVLDIRRRQEAQGSPMLTLPRPAAPMGAG